MPDRDVANTVEQALKEQGYIVHSYLENESLLMEVDFFDADSASYQTLAVSIFKDELSEPYAWRLAFADAAENWFDPSFPRDEGFTLTEEQAQAIQDKILFPMTDIVEQAVREMSAAQKSSNEPEKNPKYSFYENDGKSYISFGSIDKSKTYGVLQATHEYNLAYCVDDEKWFGDEISPSGWEDLDTEEATELAEKLGLTRDLRRLQEEYPDIFNKQKEDKGYSLSSEQRDAAAAKDALARNGKSAAQEKDADVR